MKGNETTQKLQEMTDNELQQLQQEIKNVLQERKETVKHKYANKVRDNQKLWIAQITGTHQKYGFEREFVGTKTVSETSSKHKYYDGYVEMKHGEVYEYCYGYNGKHRGFLTLKDGEPTKISNEEAQEMIQ